MAPPVEASTTRPHARACRAASSSVAVPTTLTVASKAGSSTARRTSICAARWKITSGRAAASAAATRAASATLPS